MSQLPILSESDVAASYAKLGLPAGSRLAVAVSGGADSLALLLLSAKFFPVTAITVDHGLRKNAADEAAYVASLCAKRSIPHVTLKWEGEKPKANVQAEARAARYTLMKDWCVAQHIPYLAVAHHMNDQAETVLLRLARGSGVYGLAGMAEKRPLGDGITLVRPFFGVPKDQLIHYLRSVGVRWVDDPSNDSDMYDRVKARKMLADPPLAGLNTARLAATAERLRRSRDALEYYERKWLKKAVSFQKEGYCFLDPQRLNKAPEEVVLRSLATLCRVYSSGIYVPRMEKLLRLYETLQQPDFKGQTLYGLQFSPYGVDQILVTRELSQISEVQPLRQKGCWDGRITYDVSGLTEGLSLRAVGEEGWISLKEKYPEVKDMAIPRLAILAMPAIFDGLQLRSVPFLGYNELTNIYFSFCFREFDT